MGRNRGIVARFQARFPGVLAYKSQKFIKVDVPAVAVLHRVLQAMVFLAAMAELYFNDGWALSEVPVGFINGWASPGTMLNTTDELGFADDKSYCDGNGTSYAKYTAPTCVMLLPAEVYRKTTDSVFFTTSIFETDTLGWACSGDATGARRAQCRDGGGEFYMRSNGQCGCVTSRTLLPLGVESMILGFEHAYDTSRAIGFGGNSVEEDDDKGMWSEVVFSNGTQRRFDVGESIKLTIAEWLQSVANTSLEGSNKAIRVDQQGRSPTQRLTGISVRLDIEYSNRDTGSSRAVPGKRSVHAFVTAQQEPGTWVSVGSETSWVVHPTLPRDQPQDYHLREQELNGVLFSFQTRGRIYKLDPFKLVAVLLSSVVMLKVAGVITDGVAFYLLPGGQSTLLRNKRQELVSKKSEFAELGMKAALAATTYRAFDPDNNGAIEPVDIVKVFAYVDGVSWEQAHAIAYMILEDADTDDGNDGGQFGLSFEEYMTCLEGDAINFGSFLENLEPMLDAPDREECRLAFEEVRDSLPPTCQENGRRTRRTMAPDLSPATCKENSKPMAPPEKLELSSEEKAERLKSKGMLHVHVISAAGLKAVAKNGRSDPFCMVDFGKKQQQTKVVERTLTPEWDDMFLFDKPLLLKTAIKRGLQVTVRDVDLSVPDAIGACTLQLEQLAGHATWNFDGVELSPQGTIKISVRWDVIEGCRWGDDDDDEISKVQSDSEMAKTQSESEMTKLQSESELPPSSLADTDIEKTVSMKKSVSIKKKGKQSVSVKKKEAKKEARGTSTLEEPRTSSVEFQKNGARATSTLEEARTPDVEEGGGEEVQEFTGHDAKEVRGKDIEQIPEVENDG